MDEPQQNISPALPRGVREAMGIAEATLAAAHMLMDLQTALMPPPSPAIPEDIKELLAEAKAVMDMQAPGTSTFGGIPFPLDFPMEVLDMEDPDPAMITLLKIITESYHWRVLGPFQLDPDEQIRYFDRNQKFAIVALDNWTIKWTQMPEIALINSIANPLLGQALGAYHRAGYNVARNTLLYTTTIRNYFVGWGTDPVRIYKVHKGDFNDIITAFSHEEWGNHFLVHQYKLSCIVAGRDELMKAKHMFSLAWDMVREHVGLQTRRTIDSWWEYLAAPMHLDAHFAVGALTLPGQYTWANPTGGVPYVNFETRLELARSRSFSDDPAADYSDDDYDDFGDRFSAAHYNDNDHQHGNDDQNGNTAQHDEVDDEDMDVADDESYGVPDTEDDSSVSLDEAMYN